MSKAVTLPTLAAARKSNSLMQISKNLYQSLIISKKGGIPVASDPSVPKLSCNLCKLNMCVSFFNYKGCP